MNNNTIQKSRRPVKRCRRNKNNNITTYPDIKQFSIIIIFLFQNFHKLITDPSFNLVRWCRVMLIFVFLLYLAYTMISISNISSSLFTESYTCHYALLVMVGPVKITSQATVMLSEHIKHSGNTIKLKDVKRHIGMDDKRNKKQKEQRDTIKKLRIYISRIENRLFQSNIAKEPYSGTNNTGKTVNPDDLLESRSLVSIENKESVAVDNLVHFSKDYEAGCLMDTYLKSKVSFRGLCRIVKSFKKYGLYIGKYSVSPNTLINWLVRAGITKLTTVIFPKEPVIDIVDHWIGKGKEKLFLVLRLNQSKYKECIDSKKAISLDDVTVIHQEIV